MPNFKANNSKQGLFLPVFLAPQLQPGTFEYAVDYLFDHKINVDFIEERYKNSETGAPAYNPRILLKVIIVAYSRGITSSRMIAQCCEENMVFIALSAYSRPHFTTISNFISQMDHEGIKLFREVLVICDEMGLIGRKMFAVDGCKLPSNASKEWSGTFEDLGKKCRKIDSAIERMTMRHRAKDRTQAEEHIKEREDQYIDKLEKQADKLRKFMQCNEDKIGHSGTPTKSNVTDNESAKIKSSNGVLQGYNGVAMVDDQHQVIVAAEAFGEATEYNLLGPMISLTNQNFYTTDLHDNIFSETTLTADAGFHTNNNMAMLAEDGLDAYIADRHFRRRDPRFDNAGRYKERTTKERRKIDHSRKQFQPSDFTFDPDLKHCICPAGKRMYRSGFPELRGVKRAAFTGQKQHCMLCKLRSQCLRKPDKTVARQVSIAIGAIKDTTPASYAEKMKTKIDSVVGKAIYGRRIATAEPPFAHIRHAMGLDRFSYRGKRKVNNQWMLFCIVHNLKKVFRYGNPSVSIA